MPETSAESPNGAVVMSGALGREVPALIAERVDLVDVAGLLRDAVAVSASRGHRYVDLPSELT